MKYVVTGGTGFIGSRLALKLVELGHSAVVVGLERNATERKNATFLASRDVQVEILSVTDRDAMFAVMADADYVFHLAAVQHEMNVPDSRYWEVNVEGSRNVLDASAAAGVRNLIYGSTIGVYAPSSNGPVSESSPLGPVSAYGASKLEGEKLALSYQERLPVVALRISETFGPGDGRLLKLFRAIKKGVFLVIGDGTNLHHPVLIDDLVESFLLATYREEVHGRPIVVAGTEPITTNAMVNQIARQLAVKSPSVHVPLWPFKALAAVSEAALRPLRIQPPLHRRRLDFFVRSYAFQLEDAKRWLGFQPQTDFESGVALTARWYEDEGLL